MIKTFLGKHHLLLGQRSTTRSEASCLLLPVGTRIVNCWRLGSGVETQPDFRVRLPSSLSSLPSSLLPVFEIRIYFTREHLRDILLSYLYRYVFFIKTYVFCFNRISYNDWQLDWQVSVEACKDMPEFGSVLENMKAFLSLPYLNNQFSIEAGSLVELERYAF